MATHDAPSTPTTVLVVDDEEGIRQALDRFLTRLGYRVLQAASGAEALERQQDGHPQAMLSDIRMPNMTGLELVPKALALDSDVAIIMLTAIDEPRTAIECMKLGARDYLIKPVDLDELELSLEAALRLRQLEIDRRELEQWLAHQVAERTRDLEERTSLAAEIALDAIAAADEGWAGRRSRSGDADPSSGDPRRRAAYARLAACALASHALQRSIPRNEQIRQMNVPHPTQGYPSEARSSLPQ